MDRWGHYEVTRYVAVVADEAQSIVLLQGANGVRGPLAVNDGPSLSAKPDRRVIRAAHAQVMRGTGNNPVDGIQLSFVALTGQGGDTWMQVLETHITGGGSDIHLERSGLALPYGLGLLLGLGALTAGDKVAFGVYYD